MTVAKPLVATKQPFQKPHRGESESVDREPKTSCDPERRGNQEGDGSNPVRHEICARRIFGFGTPFARSSATPLTNVILAGAEDARQATARDQSRRDREPEVF
jgi:hypothetical protein